MTTLWTQRSSSETPTETRRVRTPIGLLALTRHRHSASLTLTVAAGRAIGTHTDRAIDGRDLDAALREQRATIAGLCERHGLARIDVYAPASHGGAMVESYEIADEIAE